HRPAQPANDLVQSATDAIKLGQQVELGRIGKGASLAFEAAFGVFQSFRQVLAQEGVAFAAVGAFEVTVKAGNSPDQFFDGPTMLTVFEGIWHDILPRKIRT